MADIIQFPGGRKRPGDDENNQPNNDLPISQEQLNFHLDGLKKMTEKVLGKERADLSRKISDFQTFISSLKGFKTNNETMMTNFESIKHLSLGQLIDIFMDSHDLVWKQRPQYYCVIVSRIRNLQKKSK